jgi:phage-related protein
MAEKVIVKSATSDLDGAQLDNAATEATLLRLVNLLEKQKTGSGASVSSMASQAKSQGISPKAMKDTETGLSGVSSASKATSSVLSKTGSIASSVLSSFGSTLSFLASGPLALLGSAFSIATDTIGRSMDALRETGSVGASFNGSLLELNKAAASAGMGLEEYSKFVSKNKDTMAILGGTVTEGAQRMGQLSKELRTSPAGQQLMALGISAESMNGAMGDFMKIEAMHGRLQGKRDADIVKGSGDYLKQLGELSRLTGENVDQLSKNMAAMMLDEQVNAVLQDQTEEQQKKTLSLLEQTNNISPKFNEALKAGMSGLGDNPLWNQIASVSPKMKQLAEDMGKGTATQDQWNEALAEAGPEMAAMLKSMSKESRLSVEEYRQMGPIVSQLNMNQAKFSKDAQERAKKEGDTSTAFTSGLMNAKSTLDAFWGSIKTAFLDSSIFKAMGDGANWVAEKLNSFKEPLQSFLKNFSLDGVFGGFLPKLTKGLTDSVTGLMPDVEKMFGSIIGIAKPFVTSIGNFFTSALGGLNIDGIAKSIKNNFTSVLEQWQYVVDNFFAPVFQTINENLAKIGPKVGPIFTDLVTIASDLFGIVTSICSSIVNTLMPIVRPVVQFLIDAFTPLTDLFGVIVSTVKGIVKLLKGDFGGFAEAMKDAFGGMINFFTSTIGAIVRLLGNIITPFKESFAEIADMIETFPLYIKKAVTSILPDWVSAKLGLATSDDIDKQLAARAKAMEEAKVKKPETPPTIEEAKVKKPETPPTTTPVIATIAASLAAPKAPEATAAPPSPKDYDKVAAEARKKELGTGFSTEDEKKKADKAADQAVADAKATDAKEARERQVATLNTVSEQLYTLNEVMKEILKLNKDQAEAQKDLVNVTKGRYSPV